MTLGAGEHLVMVSAELFSLVAMITGFVLAYRNRKGHR